MLLTHTSISEEHFNFKSFKPPKRRLFFMSKKYYKLPAEILGFGLSPKAIIMYSILADRAELSHKSGAKFKDKAGFYIIYPVTDLCQVLGVGERTARYTLAELEDAGLIATKKQGKSLPQKIYVINPSDRQKIAGQERQNPAGQERQNPAGLINNTDTIYTDTSRLPELLQIIAECAAETGQKLTPKQALKVTKKVIAAKPRSPRAWIRTVLPSAAKDIDEYEATYDLAEYATSSVLDDWDE